MKFELRTGPLVSILLFIVFTFSRSEHVFSQSRVRGKVINIKDKKVIAFANITVGGTKRKAMSDASGNFTLTLNGFMANDSIFISSVGYKSLKLPVRDAIFKDEFGLDEEAREMQPVILYSKEEAIGSGSEITGYFRAWNPRKTGGEIGKIFHVDHNNYRLERVRFKVNNRCDTCLVRLHIREVVDEQPGEEILYDSISTFVNRLAFDDKFSEFDLRPYNLVLKKKNVFVGLEVLNCSKRDGEPCSICFIGTEHGSYIYKSNTNSAWEEYTDYSIYLKFFYKY
ncbi:MAG: carboxypeptidase-like regulatory domain-containing protein [Ferruginibacter sp.]